MKADWVVLDAVKQEMRCNRCGETDSLSIINGKRLDYAAGILKSFVDAHKKCKVQDADTRGK